MDWPSFLLSVKLASFTVAILLPLSLLAGRWLAFRSFAGKPLLEALLAVPLVLPPTVTGYYLLVGFGGGSMLGQLFERFSGHTLVFHFSGLLLASLIVNIPFSVQPVARAFESIPQDIRDSAACCGMGFWRTLFRVELPLAWPGVLTAMLLTFAHTMGEFGVVLMVGGNIQGETRTVAISIYDRVQAMDFKGAGVMSLLLLVISVVVLAVAGGWRRQGGGGNALPKF